MYYTLKYKKLKFFGLIKLCTNNFYKILLSTDDK